MKIYDFDSLEESPLARIREGFYPKFMQYKISTVFCDNQVDLASFYFFGVTSLILVVFSRYLYNYHVYL
ncbi:uncharacterized protein DS421_18g626030 [Arachis hypogaea]|nr:uncharacterized protein DS421_18g626030 [Arachis hypogaea]